MRIGFSNEISCCSLRINKQERALYFAQYIAGVWNSLMHYIMNTKILQGSKNTQSGCKSRKTQQYHLRYEVPTPQITCCWDCLLAKLSLGDESYHNFKFRIVEVWLCNIIKWQMISMDINTPLQGTTSI